MRGSWGVWPLRRPSPADAARVRSWRKHARAGTLPPVVLWSISGLSTHLILDGHDRLAAAAAERIDPRIMVLARAEDIAPPRETLEQALRVYRAQIDGSTGLPHRVGMNRYLTRQFTPCRTARDTAATWVPAMVDEWDREVSGRLGDDVGNLTAAVF